MRNLTSFQLGVIIIFVIVLIVAVLIFAGVLPGYRPTTGGAAGELLVWGTAPAGRLENALSEVNDDYKNYFTLRYVEKSPAPVETEFIEAKADSRAPDLILLPHNLLLTQRQRLAPLPAELLSVRDFRDTFIALGELGLTDAGIVALPLVVDPLVMYYNQS